MKTNLLKNLRKRFFWKHDGINWIVYDRKSNSEFTVKSFKSNDAVIKILTSQIGIVFTCLEVRKLESSKRRLKQKYQAKFTNSFNLF